MFGVGGSARIGIWVLGVLLGITLSPGAQNFGVSAWQLRVGGWTIAVPGAIRAADLGDRYV
jgi:hypothetical protein